MPEDSKYKAMRRHWIKWGDREVERVGSAQARSFLESIGGANSTRRSYLSLLSACWEWGSVNENPWRSITLPKSQSPDPFSQEEVDLILQGFGSSH